MARSDELADEAHNRAWKFRRWAWFFRAQFLLLIPFWFVSKEPVPERLMFVYLAAVSIHALVVTYDGNAEAAEAKAAGYTDSGSL